MQLNFINFKHSEYQIICKPSLVFLILSAGKVNKKEISLLETEWICICKSRLEHFPLLSREFSFVCAQVKTLNNIKYLIQWLFPSCQLQWEFKIENHELKTFLNVIEKTFSYHPLKLTHSPSLSPLSSLARINAQTNDQISTWNVVPWHVYIQSFPLKLAWKLKKTFFSGVSRTGKINNIQCELRTKYNLKHVSNEQKKCWLKFVELRGQISYRVEARGFFYLQLLFTNASLIPLFAWLFPPPLLPFIHIKFYLFIRLNWQLCKWPLPFTIRLW